MFLFVFDERALLFLAGVLAYCFAPNESVCRGRFFDENALLPGLAQREFANSRLIDSLSSELREHPSNLSANVHYILQQCCSLFFSSECSDHVCGKRLLFCFHREERVLELMGEFGLETYLQNFTAEPPVIMSTTVRAAPRWCASAF